MSALNLKMLKDTVEFFTGQACITNYKILLSDYVPDDEVVIVVGKKVWNSLKKEKG